MKCFVQTGYPLRFCLVWFIIWAVVVVFAAAGNVAVFSFAHKFCRVPTQLLLVQFWII